MLIRILLLCLLTQVIHSPKRTPHGSAPTGAYLLTSFSGSTLALNVQWSNDLKNWWGVDPFPSMSTTERDASITKISAGNWCIVFTGSSGAAPVAIPPGSNTAFWYSCTTNLNYWPNPASVSVTEVTGSPCSSCQAWAPEFVRNQDGTWYNDGSGFPWVSLTISTNGGTSFQMYLKHASATNLSSWSNAVSVSGVPSSMIDSQVVAYSGTFYAWWRNYSSNCLEYGSASTLTGTYTQVGTGNWAGWGCNSQEGPVLILKSGTWYLISDIDGGATSTGQMGYSTSTNWPASGASSTWTSFVSLNTPYEAKQGSMIPYP
jgi:hypothetical protein